MSTRSEVLLWAQRIVAAKKTVKPHQLLELEDGAGLDVAQEAFHKIARMAHPDLHRNNLEEAELEMVTKAYAIIANAYQTYRTQMAATTRMQPVGKNNDPAGAVPASPSGTNAVIGVAGAMSSRALVYYRKAELCLKRGDLRGASLQLKMAIGTDPASTFLRTALHEVELEARKVT